MNDYLKNKKGEPLLLMGLQAHNSSTGTPLLDKAILAIKKYGGNVLETPLYWFDIEPEEGVYRFDMIKDTINRCREAGLYLIFLWFGSSKNGHPNYVPEYIKLQPEKYRMAIGADGAPVPAISVHCMETLEKDKAAFEKVMEFIRDFDGSIGTVLAMQVQNEFGYGGTDRDYSDIAQADYEKPVPEELAGVELEDMGVSDPNATDWRGRFGRHAHEAFSAWYHARYTEYIAAAGKKIYDIPMFVNVMLGENGIEEPGHSYNTGAAVGRVIDIWKKGAPSIDLLCPDIYRAARDDYERVCARYAREDNALFIPESATTGTPNAINIIRAIGKYNAIGVCGFGAENALDDNDELTPAAYDVAMTMRAVMNAAPLLIKYRGTDNIIPIIQEEFEVTKYIRLDDYHVTANFLSAGAGRRRAVTGKNAHFYTDRGRALLIRTGKDEFFLAGAGVSIDFVKRPDPLDENPYPHLNSRLSTQLNFLSVEEGHFAGDKWVIDFIRNGDESNYALYVHDGGIVRIRMNPNRGM